MWPLFCSKMTKISSPTLEKGKIEVKKSKSDQKLLRIQPKDSWSMWIDVRAPEVALLSLVLMCRGLNISCLHISKSKRIKIPEILRKQRNCDINSAPHAKLPSWVVFYQLGIKIRTHDKYKYSKYRQRMRFVFQSHLKKKSKRSDSRQLGVTFFSAPMKKQKQIVVCVGAKRGSTEQGDNVHFCSTKLNKTGRSFC